MDLSAIQIREGGEGRESLTASLQAVARWGGLEIEHDVLNAALGLSFMVCAPQRPEPSLRWESLARDWNLVNAARWLGMELRALHPPPAAAGVESAAEFQQHFVDSYAPLIRQALEHHQPVLAWRGWPDELSWRWGVITGTCEEGLGLRGTTVRREGLPVVLVAPAAQCYVVEHAACPGLPDALEMVRFVMQAADTIAHNRVDPAFGVITGHGAYDVWLSLLGRDPAAFVDSGGVALRLSHLARLVTFARRSGLGFLAAYRDRLDPSLRPVVDALAAAASGVIAALAVPRTAVSIEPMLRSAEGRDRLAADIRQAREAERALADPIRLLAVLTGG